MYSLIPQRHSGNTLTVSPIVLVVEIEYLVLLYKGMAKQGKLFTLSEVLLKRILAQLPLPQI